MLQQLLSIYKLTPNPNTALKMSSAELMFAKKIKLVFDKLLLGRKIKSCHSTKLTTNSFKAGGKVVFMIYKVEKESWENGEIVKLAR